MLLEQVECHLAAQHYTRNVADVSILASYVTLDIIELTYLIKRLAGNLGFCRGPKSWKPHRRSTQQVASRKRCGPPGSGS